MMTPLPRWKKVILGLTSVPVLLVARGVWQWWPSLEWCILFWVIALADDPLRWSEMRWRRRALYGLATLGGVGNAAATLANGGRMPVLGKALEPGSLWIPLTDATRLPWLCDIYPLGAVTGSLGDILILVALQGLLLNWLLERAGVFATEPPVVGKRMPGMGIG